MGISKAVPLTNIPELVSVILLGGSYSAGSGTTPGNPTETRPGVLSEIPLGVRSEVPPGITSMVPP